MACLESVLACSVIVLLVLWGRVEPFVRCFQMVSSSLLRVSALDRQRSMRCAVSLSSPRPHSLQMQVVRVLSVE